MSTLRAAPFSLMLGKTIIIKVVATNNKGTSDDSMLNTVGAIVQDIPQAAPVLTRNEQTDAWNIALVWNQLPEGLDQGFAAVTGYNIYWDKSGSMEFRVSIADPEITFYSENDVDNGVMYQFKVSAVNVYGEGPMSAAL